VSRQSQQGHDIAARYASCALAVLALLILSLLLLGVALAVRVSLGRPVLFMQTRTGRDSRPFTLCKFRTMREAVSTLTALDAVATDAERLTSLGRLLRSTSIDELPQLFNVIKGDMNLVGPRPLLTEYLPLYSAHQARRHEVRPGMTGWAQVNGRNETSWTERFDMDVWYVDNRSLMLDARILLKTVGVALSRRGVSTNGTSSAVPFGGGTGSD